MYLFYFAIEHLIIDHQISLYSFYSYRCQVTPKYKEFLKFQVSTEMVKHVFWKKGDKMINIVALNEKCKLSVYI